MYGFNQRLLSNTIQTQTMTIYVHAYKVLWKFSNNDDFMNDVSAMYDHQMAYIHYNDTG